MKKVIRGRVYDTDTAKSIGWDDGGGTNCRDFGYWKEELYIKRTGEYFLYGWGGPMSKYAKSAGMNEWSGGKEIQPLTWEQARKWAEEHLSAENYMENFPIEEESTKQPVNLSLPTSTVTKMRNAAVKRGISLSDLVTTLAESINEE